MKAKLSCPYQILQSPCLCFIHTCTRTLEVGILQSGLDAENDEAHIICTKIEINMKSHNQRSCGYSLSCLSFFYFSPIHTPQITLAAMKSEVNEIALQGIEFWSTVCDEETDLAIEAAEAEEQGRPPEQVSRFYVKGALTFLIDVLLQTLTKQVGVDMLCSL